MHIFVEPSELYIRNGLTWVVESIENNLVKSRSVDHDVCDTEILKKFNREVVAGLITFPKNGDDSSVVKRGADEYE